MKPDSSGHLDDFGMSDVSTAQLDRLREVERSARRGAGLRGFLIGFATAATIGLFLCAAAHVIHFVGDFGLGFEAIPGLESITPGLTYPQVVGILGKEDGVIFARAMRPYSQHNAGLNTSAAFDLIEKQGGTHRFWLSRSSGMLIFNIISFDKANAVASTTVVRTYNEDDEYLGAR